MNLIYRFEAWNAAEIGKDRRMSSFSWAIVENSNLRSHTFDQSGVVANFQAMVCALINIYGTDLIGWVDQLVFHVPG